MASTTELRKTYTDAAKNLTGTKPFYAFVGSGDLAVEKIKDVPAKLRDEVTVAKLKDVPNKLREELRGDEGAVKKVTEKINELPRDPRKLGAKLTDLAEEQLKAADERIGKLAVRGEKVVQKVRTDTPGLDKARDAVKKVRNRGKDVQETPAKVATPPAARRTPRAAATNSA
jgi:heparin binding hemagglutinin HbhA